MWRFLKKLQIELPYDPAIPLLGIHIEETRIERDTCNPMFIAALFIIARTWKQPRCSSGDTNFFFNKWRKIWKVEKTCKLSFINMEYKIRRYLIQRNLVLSSPPFLFQQECLFWSFHSCKFLMVQLKEKLKPLSQMRPGIHSSLPVHAKSSRSP